MAADLTEKEFARHLKTKFTAKIGEENIDLELIEVKTYFPQAIEQGGMERFSVFFDGPADRRLPQQTYQLQHDAMGEFGLFLVPISEGENGLRYEAVFNYYK